MGLHQCLEIKEDEHEFDYLKGSGKGPEDWWKINPQWKACGKGEMQSPIDLLNKRVKVVPDLGRLQRCYKPARAMVTNRGHDIMVKFSLSFICSFLFTSSYILSDMVLDSNKI